MSIKAFFSGAAGPSNKRPREEDDTPKPAVATVVTWNANSLLQRVQNNAVAMRSFLADHAPDAIFVCEVRMPAAGPPGCKKDDGKPRRRGEMARSTAAQSKEADAITTFVRSAGYKAYWTLADHKYSGCGLLVRTDRAQPTDVRCCLDPSASSSGRHHPEGRILLAHFEHLDLLGTYVPNNGTSEASFARRRQWEAEMDAFLARPRHRPLCWLGDLNVAVSWNDVGPDPDWFRRQGCQEAADPSDKGQPGFTANEQMRFERTLKLARLHDAYRLLHPTASWERDVTWRGTPGREGTAPEAGRYYGKGMRIDYVCTSESIRVARAVVLGLGAARDGFMGSDHCPLLVELRVDDGAGARLSNVPAVDAPTAAAPAEAGAAAAI